MMKLQCFDVLHFA